MRTANPALNTKILVNAGRAAAADTQMTIQGAVNKTGVLLLLLLAGASLIWHQFHTTGPESIMMWMFVGLIGGLILALATMFKPTWAPVTAPLYALFEGAALGGLSAMLEMQFPGIAMQAMGMTFGTLLCLLVAYKLRIIRVTDKFRAGVVAATGGIFVIYLATWILGFFGVGVPFIHESGLVGIGFSVFVVIVAALNLVLDFDFIERGAQAGAPKYMEWYAAFGLMVTLVWLYMEILRLLSKLRRR